LRSEFESRAAHFPFRRVKPLRGPVDLGRMGQRGVRVTLGLVAAVAVAVLVVVLAQGGDERPLSADQYRKQLVGAFADVQLDANPIDGGALHGYADEFHELVDELAKIVPPPEAAAMHARLVDGLYEYAKQLDSLADSGRAGAVAFQQRLAETGGAPGQEWVQAFNELAARGYLTYELR
jgi:hypothetical protein